MWDGVQVPEGSLGDEGDVVAMEWEDPEVAEASKGVTLDAAQLVVRDDAAEEEVDGWELEGDVR